MLPAPSCRAVRDELAARLGEAPSPQVARHVVACAACAEVARRDVRLRRLLEAQPRAPRVTLRAPVLPEPGRRLVLPGWIAAAAAAILVGAIVMQMADRPLRTVHVDRVVDVAGGAPPIDERLLALTSGAEAVAMRRPTEER